MVGGYKNYDGVFAKNTRIGSSTTIIQSEKLQIQDHVYIGQYNFLDASNSLKIEEGCQITSYVSVLTHSSHISIRLYGNQYINVPESDKIGYKRGPVLIGAYTFIGPHVVIMPGTKIGKGCIISAFSYLDGEYPDFSVIGGQPAKILKSTKELDQPFLDQDEALKSNYLNWSQKKY
jgi:acetyltransferase-like isoleucine patch superfamily enzyme